MPVHFNLQKKTCLTEVFISFAYFALLNILPLWCDHSGQCSNYLLSHRPSRILGSFHGGFMGDPQVPKSWLSILNSSIFRWEWVPGPMNWIHFFVVASRQDGCFLQQRHGSLVSWSGHRGHLPWSDLHSRAPALRTYELSQWRNNRCRWSIVNVNLNVNVNVNVDWCN